MSITKKIAFLQIVLMVSFICIIIIMGQLVWGKSYLELEQQEIKDNAVRAYQAWEDELDFLGALVGDWAPWDDPYRFAQNPADREFVEKNLTDAAMANLKINMAIITDTDGKVLFAKGIDSTAKTEVKLPREVVDELSGLTKNYIPDLENEEPIKTFIVIEKQPLFLAMHRILTSDKKGPSTGNLIFAKYGDEAFFKEISKRTQVNLFFDANTGPWVPDHTMNNGLLQVDKGEEIHSYYSLLDAYGNNRYLVSITPRTIYKQGKDQMKSFLILTIGFGFFFICITMVLLNRVILSKLRKMESFMSSIASGNDYSVRLELPGSDELSKVAATMNSMLNHIEVSHKEIKSLYRAVSMELEERHKVEQHLKYLSLHDSLTGLYNRTFFEQEIDNLAQRQIQSVGMICCDLDGLKIFNDTMGHHVGDNILAETARMLSGAFGDGAVVARIGGDEFAAIIVNINEDELQQICEKIREVEIKDPEGRGAVLHLSLGWAYYSGTNVTRKILLDLLKQADDWMYRCKLSSSYSKRNALVQGMLEMLKARDFMTEGHSQRLHQYVESLGKMVNLKETQLADLRLLAQFHDIGKVGIPDSILFKQGPLTPEERKEMERHAEIGRRIAQAIPELTPVSNLILKHHEWWNGNGYPLGLKGEDIPIENRILAIADAYDAMTSDRPYRKALKKEDAIAELQRFAGIQFDPDLVEKFIAIVMKDEFCRSGRG